MKIATIFAAALLVAVQSAPALAYEENGCNNRRGEDRAGTPQRPDVKGRKKEQVAPLSIPAPDAKAPAKPAAPGTKTACDSDAGCDNNR